MYVHPLERPAAWRRLARAAPELHSVVVNPADGPGTVPDPAYEEAAARLRRAGVPLLGYVDTGYGAREVAAAVRDVERHRRWYGVDGVFLDCTAADAGWLGPCRELTAAARADGARSVVLNPGVHPDPGYARIADLLVTFEGDWSTYRAAEVPRWTHRFPPDRFCHLVYGVPAALLELAGRTARGRGAAVHLAVEGVLPNPWRGLPNPGRGPDSSPSGG